ncbi:hypothetical protein BJV82DRAFT_610467 [Fennellomyces sp. T-0311]|nr:hypothetical protein BJV82DRAFT_610467 [Fennellomyces sp. T-0311]
MLPLETLERIAIHVHRRDILCCLTVCREWYFVFLPCLYRSIEISNNANAWHAIQHHQDSLCHNVHELLLDDGLLSLDEINAVRTYCPNLVSIYFCWWRPPLLSTLLSMASPSAQLTAMEESIVSTVTFESPVPALRALCGKHIRQLTLSCLSWEPAYIYNMPTGSDFDDWLRRILGLTPCLQYLALENVLPSLDIRHVEIIHASCPDLVDFVSAGPARIMYTRASTSVVPKMRSLRLVYAGGWNEAAGSWLKYASYCYPNLETLYLENASGNPTWFSYTSSVSHSLAFPQLKQAHLIRLDLDYNTVYAIQSQAPRLYDLSIDDRCCWLSSSGFDQTSAMNRFNDFIVRVQDRVLRLRLSLPEVYPSLSAFRSCTKLRDLSLKSSESVVIDLRVLLDGLHALKRLSLTHADLIDQVLWASTQSPIARLELDQVKLTSDGIKSILMHCHQIDQLIATQCFWYHTSMYTPIGVQMELPQRHFYFIQINSQRLVWAVSTYVTAWDPIQVYGLTSPECQERWLNIATRSDNNKKSLTGSIVELQPDTMKTVLKMSYADILKKSASCHYTTVDGYKTGGYMTISYSSVSKLVINGEPIAV